MHPAPKSSQAKHCPTKPPSSKSTCASLTDNSKTHGRGKPKGGKQSDDPVTESKDLARKRFTKAAVSIRALIRFQKALSTEASGQKRGSHKSSAPIMRLENTYRTEPRDEQRFKPDSYQGLVEEMVQQRLERYTYDKSNAPMVARALTASITDSLKGRLKTTAPRYKLICNVIIGQTQGQGINVTSRAVWNDKTDNYISFNYNNNDLFAVVMVHAAYKE